MDVQESVVAKQATQALEAHFRQVPIGELVDFKAINQIAGLDVTKNRGIIETVKRALLRHHDRVLVNVRGAGYLVADTNRTLVESAGHRKKSFGHAKKAYKLTTVVNLEGLSDSERMKVINEQAKAGLMMVAFKAGENKAIKARTSTLNQPEESDIIALLLDRAKRGN